MSVAQGFVAELDATLRFFKKTVSCFDEGDSGYAPKPDMYTVAGHIAHTADSVDWFLEGAFGKGWDMEFDAMIAKAKAVTSLAEALEWLDRSFAEAKKVVGSKSDEELFLPIADQAIMKGAPRGAVIGAITDHTGHHRGALAVYGRLLEKEVEMPYA